MVFSKSIGDQNLLQRKIARNPRYANVESKLDTGASMTRFDKRVTDIQENFKLKPNEIFKRVKLSTFAELILQVAEQDRVAELTDYVNEPEEITAPIPSSGILPDSIQTSTYDNIPHKPTVIRTYTNLNDVISGNGERNKNKPEIQVPQNLKAKRSYTTLNDVISGTGEKHLENGDFDLENKTPEKIEIGYKNCPYLLLDVQKEHLFEKCHIRSAIHFDPCDLNRTMNPYTDEIRKFMNKEEKIIVVYDENEDLATKVVKNLTERGVTNVFLLSGGLKLIARRGLHNLVTGPYPRICFREDIEKAKNSIPRRNFIQPGPDQINDRERSKFNDSELAQLRFELDKYNQDASTASSIFSTSRGGGSVSSARSSTRSIRLAAGGKPGWK